MLGPYDFKLEGEMDPAVRRAAQEHGRMTGRGTGPEGGAGEPLPSYRYLSRAHRFTRAGREVFWERQG